MAPFAFRVRDEIAVYVGEAEELDVPWQEALDEQLLQNVLPTLKGADLRVVASIFVDCDDQVSSVVRYADLTTPSKANFDEFHEVGAN